MLLVFKLLALQQTDFWPASPAPNHFCTPAPAPKDVYGEATDPRKFHDGPFRIVVHSMELA